MQKRTTIRFNTFYWLLALILFVLIAIRAWFIPFSHDETATFFYYIQSDNYLPYKAHVYTNNHVLNSALSNICYHLLGSHPFVLRLPNVLSFILLSWGVYRHFKHLQTTGGKITLITFYLLTFCFLDIFQLCRGYGLSVALMVWGLSHLIDYFQHKKQSDILLFSTGLQLALAANLTLLPACVILLSLVFLFQLTHRSLFYKSSMGLTILNLLLLGFWTKFTLFYKEAGMLDAGSLTDYWNTTFVSLVDFVFGSKTPLVLICCITGTLLLIYALWLYFFRNRKQPHNLFNPLSVYTSVFLCLILGFLLLNKIGNVNFPEDRTALFFYLFFTLALPFALEYIHTKLSLIAGSILLLSSGLYFVTHFNYSHFSSYFYHTMPPDLFHYLQNEQKKTTTPLTIGGSKSRELNFAFMNYREGAPLNPMNVDECMPMYNDYQYALDIEKPYYSPYYEEIMRDTVWHRVLLKRKEPISRKILICQTDKRLLKTSDEFTNLLDIKDSALSELKKGSLNPLETEIELKFEKVPKPFNAFLVLSINDGNANQYDYRRIPLNWLGANLNKKTLHIKLTSCTLPSKLSSLVIYIWNIEKQPYKIHCNQLKLCQLNGKGINFRVPETFYPLMGKTNGIIQL